jgi:hypothetical protein
MRVDGRGAVQVAVQQRVVDLESSSFEERQARDGTSDESFVLAVEGSDDEDVDNDGCWWWQSMGTEAAK